MKPLTRTASVVWEGSHQHGEGALTTQSAILKKARYVSGNHFEGEQGTNPFELIAAALASSYSMALANELGRARHNPEHIDIRVTVNAASKITKIQMNVIALVPRATQCNFIDAAMLAKTSCSISRLLQTKISMHAKLKRGVAAAPGFQRAATARRDSTIKSKHQRKTKHGSGR